MQIDKETCNSKQASNPINRKLIAHLIQAYDGGCLFKDNSSLWLEMRRVTSPNFGKPDKICTF